MTKANRTIFDYIGEGIWLLFGGEPISEPRPMRTPKREHIPTEEELPKIMTTEERAQFTSDMMRDSFEKVGNSLYAGIKKANEMR